MRLITSILDLNSRYKISTDDSKARFHRHRATQAAITHPPSPPLLASHLHRHRPTALNNNNRRRTVCLKSLHTNSSSGDQPPPSSSSASLSTFLSAFYKFTRPHTMLGTMISVISISLLGIPPSTSTSTSTFLLFLPSSSSSIHPLCQALSSALLMNICIVGINQIYDIEIDKINKPYLPLASGKMTVSTALSIVLITGVASLGIGVVSGSGPLLVTLVGSLLLGIAYSVDIPLLRWKQYPVAAAACILAVRALLVQLGFFQHMFNAMSSGSGSGSVGGGGGLLQWFTNLLSYLIPTLSHNSSINTSTIYQAALSTPTIQFATGFMLLFSIVIALFKDIPDVRGDARAGIQTLSVRWGTRNVYWACIIILELAYGWAIVFGMLRGKVLASVAHAVLAAVLWWRGGKTDLDDRESISDCYMDSWKLFYIEYLLLPLLN